MRGSRDRLVALAARCCPVTQQAKVLADPQHAVRDVRLAAGFRISQKPRERGAFTLEVFEPLDFFATTKFSYAAAETATERPGP